MTDDQIRKWNAAAAARRRAEVDADPVDLLASGSAWMAGRPVLTEDEKAADRALLALQRERNARSQARKARRSK